MTVWKQIDEMKAKFDSEPSGARAEAKLLGFKDVRCNGVDLSWSAKPNPAPKFDYVKGRPSTLGPFKTAAQLVKAMRAFSAPAGGATNITAEDHAKAASFLDAKR